MPTFIDESGDTGSKPGSLPYFRLAAVWLPNREVVEACRASVRAVRTDLDLPADFEFKFARTEQHPERRTAFLAAALQHEFRFAVCSYDKTRITRGSLSHREFHWGCAVTLAAYLRETYQRAERDSVVAGGKFRSLDELVVVDDNQDREFLTTIKQAFRGLSSGQQAGAKLVGKVKFRDSRPDEMLQLIDMVVGAVGAHLSGDSQFFRLIAARSVGVVCLP